jgi:hypothetical protein|tara:strand:- start:219 stop:419 length:201 start_codon:yes stop_codon:yes gene_type:complete
VIKEKKYKMNITDIKMAILGTLGLYINLSGFNTFIATLTGVVILGYTISRWYYLIKENNKSKKKKK